jgi:hypothetical protein
MVSACLGTLGLLFRAVLGRGNHLRRFVNRATGRRSRVRSVRLLAPGPSVGVAPQGIDLHCRSARAWNQIHGIMIELAVNDGGWQRDGTCSPLREVNAPSEYYAFSRGRGAHGDSGG